MPVDVSSILQFKLFQEFRGQQVLNVQHYLVLSTTEFGTLTGFANVLFNYWTDQLSPLVSEGLSYVRGELYEVNGLDFDVYVSSPPIVGVGTGDTLPPFNAVSVQQVRASRATRHGWKRFAGILEPQQDDGILLPANLTAWQQAMDVIFDEEVTYADPLTPTRTLTLAPIIWGGNDPAFPLGRYSLIAGVQVKEIVSSQNTRKIPNP